MTDWARVLGLSAVVLTACAGDREPLPGTIAAASTSVGAESEVDPNPLGTALGDGPTTDDSTSPDSSAGPGTSTGQAATCGNGVVEAGELCDDGNTVEDDGCDAVCQSARCLVPLTHRSIQAAVDDEACPTVWVLPGRYVETVVVERDLELRDTDAGEVTLDGGGQGTTLRIDSGAVLVGPLRITGGYATEGGGIHTTGFVQLQGTLVTGNEAADPLLARGGGLLSDDGTVILDGARFTGNSATVTEPEGNALGGGIFAVGGTLTTAGDALITGNGVVTVVPDGSIVAGGGIFAETTAVELGAQTQIVDNLAQVTGDFLVPDARAFARGGGLYLRNASLAAPSGTSFTGNTARVEVTSSFPSNDVYAEGGALYAESSTVEFFDAHVDENSAQGTSPDTCWARGGGLAVAGDSLVTLTRTSVVGNLAYARVPDVGSFLRPATAQGGGLFTGDALPADGTVALTIVDSTITGNQSVAENLNPFPTAHARGGALFLRPASGTAALNALIAGTTVATNSVQGLDTAHGGGLFAVAGVDTTTTEITIQNSTFSGNAATADVAHGGGVRLTEGPGDGDVLKLSLANVTFTTNEATEGGGLHLQGALAALNLRGSIIQGNQAPTSPDLHCTEDALVSTGHNLLGAELGGCTAAPTDLTGLAALLLPLGDNGGPTPTHAPLPMSPSIDGGPAECTDPDGVAIVVDQRGEPRPAGLSCDIGAIEAQP